MDSLRSFQGLSVPDPRPVVTGPSTAARNPDPRPVTENVKPPRHHEHPRPGRSHVQQGLHQITREIRHAIKDEVKAGDLDLETIGSIRDLQRDFRRDLQGVFLQAGQQGGVDRRQVLEGMIEALQSLAAGLREISSQDQVEPGSLVDLTG